MVTCSLGDKIIIFQVIMVAKSSENNEITMSRRQQGKTAN